MPEAPVFPAATPVLPTQVAALAGQVRADASRVALAFGLLTRTPATSSCMSLAPRAAAALGGDGTVWYPLSCALGGGAVAIHGDFVIALADALMGGNGVSASRPPGPLETRIVARHLSRLLVPIAEALAPVGAGELATGDAAEHPPASGTLLAITIELVAGETTGQVVVGVPVPLSPAPAPPAAAPALVVTAAARAALAGVPISLSARLPGTTVSAAELDDLAPGDVIRLDFSDPAPVLVTAGERVLLAGALSRGGPRFGIVVERLVEDL